jgi:LAO/AO transport system kinase
MHGHALDPGVYIRSMATRGQHGGLALAAHGAVRVLEAAGFAWIIVETVGTGQVEVAVGDLADTVVAVLNPGWGDEMQAAKAGLLEIADLVVVNKADRPGLSQTVLDLKRSIDVTDRPTGDWTPPIVEATATAGQGVQAVLDAIRSHRAWLDSLCADDRRRTARVQAEIRALLADSFDRWLRGLTTDPDFAEGCELVAQGTTDPATAAAHVLERFGRREPGAR